MNSWLIFTILFGALTTYCGFQAALHSSKDQTERIESRLLDLGNRLQTVQSAGGNSQPNDVKVIKQEYSQLAKKFFENLPVKVAQQKAYSADELIKQLNMSRDLEARFRLLQTIASDLAVAYNAAANHERVRVSVTEFPLNIFAPKESAPYRILLDFDKRSYWAIRSVSYPDRTIAIQFVRLTDPNGSLDYRNMLLTSDSINLILIGGKLRMSLNESISAPIRNDVVGDIQPGIDKSLQELDETAALILRRIIEHELVISRVTLEK